MNQLTTRPERVYVDHVVGNHPVTRHGCVITPAGLIIGGAYRKRPRSPQLDALLVQASYCPPPTLTLREHLLELLHTCPVPLLWSIALVGVTVGVCKALAGP